MTDSPAARRLLALLYLAGILVFADQAADLVATLVANPAPPGGPNWRFGAFGLLISRASVLVVADVMLFAAAIGLGHAKVLRFLGVAHLAAALLLVAGLGVFVLDWLQVRSRVRAEAMRSFDLATLRAGVIVLLALMILIWAGVASLRSTRAKAKSKARREEATPLLTGSPQDGPS